MEIHWRQIKPGPGRCVVENYAVPERTGLIIIAENTREEEERLNWVGIVRKVGEPTETDYGRVIEPHFKEGDRVLKSPTGAINLEWTDDDGKKKYGAILNFRNIVCVLEDGKEIN